MYERFCLPQAILKEPQMPKTTTMASRKSRAESVSDKAVLIARRLSAHASRAFQPGWTRLALIGGICALALIVMGLQFPGDPEDSMAGPEVTLNAVSITG